MMKILKLVVQIFTFMRVTCMQSHSSQFCARSRHTCDKFLSLTHAQGLLSTKSTPSEHVKIHINPASAIGRSLSAVLIQVSVAVADVSSGVIQGELAGYHGTRISKRHLLYFSRKLLSATICSQILSSPSSLDLRTMHHLG